MGRKRKNNKEPKVHSQLEGLDITINEFGEIVSKGVDINTINDFLTKNVPDKKLINRNDDAYQQEFKEMGFGGEEDEEDSGYIEESETEDEEEDLGAIIGKPGPVSEADESIEDLSDMEDTEEEEK